jgi:GNAT superfamily N-acetyltransferase
MKENVDVRLLQEPDLAEADRIMRLAFGTFLGLPDPMAFMGDVAYARPRWLSDPTAAFGAWNEGALAGTNFVTDWGSFGFFGPLTIRPDLWDRGIAQRLMEATMQCFSKRGTKHAGLFTFAQSSKHVALYQKFGFWPRFLTAVMSKPVERKRFKSRCLKFSEIPNRDHDSTLKACFNLTNAIYDGLDVGIEIRGVNNQKSGETLLLWDESRLSGIAVCHSGAGTEAGSGRCYVKFAAVLPGPTAEPAFESLVEACEEMAATQGLSRLIAGVNMARHEAYRCLMARGFRADILGVAMQKPNEAGYNRPGVYAIDDWR